MVHPLSHLFSLLISCYVIYYRERKRLANGEKTALSAADEKALLAARENGTATTTCDHGHGEGAECETCKRALLEGGGEEEVPPPYVEAAAANGPSTSVVRA